MEILWRHRSAWKDYSAMNGLITFTLAQEEDERWLGCKTTACKQETGSVISGEEAKHFYESVVKESEDGGREKQRRRTCDKANKRKVKRESPHTTTTTSERDGHRLLKCAQEGDLAGLKELLEKKGCNINFQDAYYWTAIMCASYAGQQGAVRFLLHKRAVWVGVVDSQGRDARDLAVQAGHTEVVRELELYATQEEKPIATNSATSSEPSWCAACRTQYSESELRHQSSTLHQFSLRRPPPAPQYCLPPTSAGFRMMLRDGWDPGAGLGPEGAGRRQPVGTVLKRDQGGLGYGPSPRARVTHFKAKDTRAVQQAPKAKRRLERGATLSQRTQRRTEEEDRKWERNFRTYFDF